MERLQQHKDKVGVSLNQLKEQLQKIRKQQIQKQRSMEALGLNIDMKIKVSRSTKELKLRNTLREIKEKREQKAKQAKE